MWITFTELRATDLSGRRSARPCSKFRRVSAKESDGYFLKRGTYDAVRNEGRTWSKRAAPDWDITTGEFAFLAFLVIAGVWAGIYYGSLWVWHHKAFILIGMFLGLLALGIVKSVSGFAGRVNQGRITTDHVTWAISIAGGVALAWWLISTTGL